MLDSRYVHLHEALGLGAMWLKQHAKVITLPTMATAPVSTPLPSPPPVQQPPISPSSARLAVLKKINSTTLSNKTLPQTQPEPTPTHHSLNHHLHQLSGSIAPVKVMVMSVCASPADQLAGRLFSGEDGILLHKMLAAIHLPPEAVYISTWLEDLPKLNQITSEHVIAASAQVQAKWQLSQAKAWLLMGKFFEREDVQAALDEIRGDAPYFIIPHPQHIINNTQLKRSAWETLQTLAQYLTQIEQNEPPLNN